MFLRSPTKFSIDKREAVRAHLATYSLFDRSGYICGLDAIRAASIVLVMLSHYGFNSVVPGGVGVTIFFFLSGFLITSLLDTEYASTKRINIGAFYLRRFFRLTPELWLYVVVSALIGMAYRAVTARDVLAAIFYVSNYTELWVSVHGGIMRWTQLWSLAVEEHYYLIFPVLLLSLIRRDHILLVVLCSICIAMLGWRCWIVAHGAPFGLDEQNSLLPYTFHASDTRLDSIIYGAIASIAFRRWGNLFVRMPSFASAAGIVGILLMLLSIAIRSHVFRETVRYSVQGIGLLGIFIALFFSPRGSSIRKGPMEWPLPVLMGRLSYGAYLWHAEFAFAVTGLHGQPNSLALWQKLILLLVAIPTSFAIAAISLRFAKLFAGLRKRAGSITVSNSVILGT